MQKTLIANCVAETHKHVRKVQEHLNKFIKDLIHRGQVHDNSKFEEPELSIFAQHTPELAKTQYGTPEYAELLKKVQPAIDHHYSKNRHHTEFWKNGINDMTLVDLVEMLCDWKAATDRNKNGNIRQSLEVNAKRYNMSEQLSKIFENTVKEYFNE